MVTDLRPVRPLASRSTYLIVLACVVVAAFALAACSMPAYGWEEMGPFKTTLVLAALGFCAAACLGSLSKQMTPAGLYKVRPEFLPPLVVGALALGSATLFHFEREETFWADSWICLKIGLEIAVPTAMLLWLVLRKGVTLAPGLGAATTGVLAGLA